MAKVVHPLDGEADEVRISLRDTARRSKWGEVRVRRDKDLLLFEARQTGLGSPWKLFLQMTAVDGKLMQATFGLRGGVNDDASRST